MSRFNHKAAESEWRAMSAADRNTFKSGTKVIKQQSSLKFSTIIKGIIVVALCLGMYHCLGGTAECQPAVRCAD